MKKCKICGIDKPEEHFKAFRAKDGLRRMKYLQYLPEQERQTEGDEQRGCVEWVF